MAKWKKLAKSFFSIVFITILLFDCHQKNRQYLRENFKEYQIYNELIARKAVKNSYINRDTIPNKNPELEGYSTDSLVSYIKTIYDEDDRYNLYEDNISADVKVDAVKAACIILKNQIKPNEDGTYSLLTDKSYGRKNMLCNDEKYWAEPAISFCSGFAISKKLFATAGHCLTINNLKNIYIVYGYYMISDDKPNLKINKKDIYEPIRMVGREFENTTNDYSIVEIKNVFENIRIANVRKSGKVANNTPMHVIGYPSGLPLKVAVNARIFNNQPSNYFTINSDTYRGNSGSPVFNSVDHTVEGILVRGQNDFQLIDLNNCFVSLRCPENLGTCRGEDVSRISQFIKILESNPQL